MRIARYDASMRGAWDGFVRSSRNGTFLFERAYMEYHADRFKDHSLMVSNERDEIVALLPANEAGDQFSSHGGLTYGGFVVGSKMTTPAMLEAFEQTLAYLRGRDFASFRYKPVPHIYHLQPAQEDLYALFRHGGRIYRRDVLVAVAPSRRLPYQERRVRKVKQAAKAGVRAEGSRDFAAYWTILEENLARSHAAAPVHSLAEITQLAGDFPENIRLHLARDDAGPVAGVVIYDTGRVAKVQYIASNERGRDVGALDLLFVQLLEREYAARDYFDFGSSNGPDGTSLNVGLIEQKEGFGARAVAQDFYEVALA